MVICIDHWTTHDYSHLAGLDFMGASPLLSNGPALGSGVVLETPFRWPTDIESLWTMCAHDAGCPVCLARGWLWLADAEALRQ